MAARHHADLVLCRKQPGIHTARLCAACDGKCPICDSYVRPATLARICDQCAYGTHPHATSTTGSVSSHHFLPSTARGVGHLGGTSQVTQVTVYGKCLICNGPGVSDAFYCRSCTVLEKDREGCPKIINVSAAQKDNFYERKRAGY